MVYLSMLMALEDERVFRKALEAAGNALGVEVFSFAYSEAEMPLLAEKIRAFAGRPMTFHGPMHGVELSQAPLLRAPDAYLRAFTLARQCGARHMVAHTHETHVTLKDKASRMRYCEDNLRLLSREAAEYGVTLCVENVSLPNKGAPLFDEAEYIALVQRLPQCRALIDVGHVHCTGWNLARLCQALGDRISGFHLHSNDGREDAHAWLHEGTLDVSAMLKIVAPYGNRADLVLEYANTEGKTAEDLLRDVSLLAM